MNKLKGRTIGIDLGTTNSVVAHINESGQPEVICNREGERTTPSVFAVTKTGYLIGKLAVLQEGTNAIGTRRSIKRLMGQPIRVDIGEKSFSPEEVSAEILRKLKSDAEAYFGEPVLNAVITVPAYFDANQRQSTKVAGELAGLNVLRVINEPTAAAVAYGLDKKHNETVLVFDLGGGTFDVTVMEISDDGVFEVLSTSGDSSLGGDDFDHEIIKLTQIEPTQCTAEQNARLRDAAEKAKFMLSASESAEISIPYFDMIDGKPHHVSCSITREDFEDALKQSWLPKIKACVDDAISSAHLKPNEINEIVFVGGSTRVPLIAEQIKEWIGKVPNRSINPDEAVALGAAVQAAILSGEKERDMLLLDVIPISLGVETEGGVMTTIIPRNKTIPTEETLLFTTSEDDQKQVNVNVFQGERPKVRDNRKLDAFCVPLEPMPRGVPKIDITFKIDANGILAVKAKNKMTLEEKEVVVTGSSTLTQDEIARMLADASAHKEQDEAEKALNDMRSLLKSSLISVETLLRESKSALDLNMVDDLTDLKDSLVDSQTLQDMNILEQLALSAQETIQLAQNQVYRKADEYIQSETT